MKFILGSKLNMSQVFDETGNVIPVTVVKAGPLKVLQVKKAEGKDGYNAVRVGFAGKTREFRTADDLNVGQELDVAQFAVGLAIVLCVYRNRRTIYSDEINLLKF